MTTSADDGLRDDERERSAALRSFGLLDTPREDDFDDLARIASEVCGTPIAIVNLLDTDRQFFKAEVGVGNRGTPPLGISFCRHAILDRDVTVVPDATADQRFADNPLVTEDPNLRFYAGAPLVTREGHAVGTMCVFDVVPRRLDDHQLRTLRLLARQAMTQMELRRSLAQERRSKAATDASEARYRQVFDSAVDFAIATMDLDGTVTSWNPGASRILGWTEGEMRGRPAHAFFVPEDVEAGIPEKEMAAAREEGRGADERWHLRRDGSRFWASGEMMPLRDGEGAHVGYLKILRDRTREKEAQSLRDDLAKETTHRMKNVMAMVQAVASQTFRTARTLEEGRVSMEGRLAALGRAQDILGKDGWEVAGVRDVVAGALDAHRSGEGRIVAGGPDVVLDARQGLGLSLAVHELATNAAKYGSLSGSQGRVSVSWTVPEAGGFEFEWTERGGPAVIPPARTGFGTKLIERIVASYFDADAKLHFEPEGVRFRMTGRAAVAAA